jgi:hypothetical protein
MLLDDAFLIFSNDLRFFYKKKGNALLLFLLAMMHSKESDSYLLAKSSQNEIHQSYLEQIAQSLRNTYSSAIFSYDLHANNNNRQDQSAW